jgi:hypothetical protein
VFSASAKRLRFLRQSSSAVFDDHDAQVGEPASVA